MPRRLFVGMVVAAGAAATAAIIELVKPGPISAGLPTEPVAAATSVLPATNAPAATPSTAPAVFDKAAFSIDDPTSIWFVVNKLRPIPDATAFVPPGLLPIPASMLNPFGHKLRPETIDALAQMFTAAQTQIGVTLVAQSGYRSFQSQTDAYASYVDSLGTAAADATSARPGYSEHQTGFAIDILDTISGCGTDGDCLGNTPTGRWLANNAYLYGFLLRYQNGQTEITGYEYEPWHFRFIGTNLATHLHTIGIATLEEFFGLPAAPSYAT
ncbi:hypothetical protein GCM10011399_16080 [Subtercola lobariae]|uniref:D-alanyl-D-alanine carboxypeptidase-like core domain-containing protein n=1 Tax=Subtercola lobariae TaxID=1588641 RepID=A0A917B6B9_9MICO|nr:hypothetical protein GCM10011399_16080 [Subtercola lobariae]